MQYRRLLSVVVAAVLTFGLLPSSALANPTQNLSNTSYVSISSADIEANQDSDQSALSEESNTGEDSQEAFPNSDGESGSSNKTETADDADLPTMDATGSNESNAAVTPSAKQSGPTEDESFLNLANATVTVVNKVRNETGSNLQPQVNISINGQALSEGSDYELLYNGSDAAPSKAGHYELTAQGIENAGYSGSIALGYFDIVTANIDENDVYFITNSANSELVLDAAKAAPVEGANVSAYTLNGGNNQCWSFKLNKDGYFTITNLGNSNLVLGAQVNTPISGTNVGVFRNNGSLSNRWVIVPDKDNGFKFLNAANDDLLLDASKAAPVSGANVTTYVDTQGANQRWGLQKANDLESASVQISHQLRNYTGQALSPDISVSIFDKTLTQDIDYEVLYNGTKEVPVDLGSYEVTIKAVDGYYTGVKHVGTFVIYPALKDQQGAWIRNVANPDLVLDAAKAAPVSGANVSAYEMNGGSNQIWTFELDNQGYYIIRNLANQDLVLDAAKAAPVSGANVSAYLDNGGLNQRWIIAQSGEDHYQIINAANNSLLLDASKAHPISGANVTAYLNTEGDNQCWTVESLDEVYASLDALANKNKPLVKDGTYVIYSELETHPVISVANDSQADGANIEIDPSNDKGCQKWKISHDDTGYLCLQNESSGLYLSVASENPISGNNIVQRENNGDRASKWIALPNDDGSITFQSALLHDVVLDIQAASVSPGTNVQLYNKNDTKAQSFNLISVPAQVGPCDRVLNEDEYFYIRPHGISDVQLDITKASPDNGANVELWNDLNTMWQMFYFEYDNGYYRIHSASTGKVLDVANNSLVPHSNVVMFDSYDDADNQLWAIQQEQDGSYIFVNKKNGLQLSVNSADKGSNVETDLAGASAIQSFDLVEVQDLMPTGTFRFTPVSSPSMSLDITGASDAEGANAEIWSSYESFAQKWFVQKVEGMTNIYTLQAVCSGKYLADKNGNAIQTATLDANAQWKVNIDRGNYVFINAGTGRVLDVDHAGSTKGTNVGTWNYLGGDNQRWVQHSVDAMASGTYIIKALTDKSLVFDIPHSSLDNNVQVGLWSLNDGGNQKYNISKNSDGTYTITNCLSGKVLDASKQSTQSGTKIIQYNKLGGPNQRWYIEYAGDGGFKFVSAMDASIVMTLNTGAVTKGASIELGKDTNNSAQHFTFSPTTYVPPLPADRQEMLNTISDYRSNTQWLIAVNRSTHKVGVFKGSMNNWSLQYYWDCVTGAPGTPTITGNFYTTGFKRTALTTDSRAQWATQIWGGYFFHTILVSNNELGNSLSHGCIRLAHSNALWIYNNIFAGTRVVIYG